MNTSIIYYYFMDYHNQNSTIRGITMYYDTTPLEILPTAVQEVIGTYVYDTCTDCKKYLLEEYECKYVDNKQIIHNCKKKRCKYCNYCNVQRYVNSAELINLGKSFFQCIVYNCNNVAMYGIDDQHIYLCINHYMKDYCVWNMDYNFTCIENNCKQIAVFGYENTICYCYEHAQNRKLVYYSYCFSTYVYRNKYRSKYIYISRYSRHKNNELNYIDFRPANITNPCYNCKQNFNMLFTCVCGLKRCHNCMFINSWNYINKCVMKLACNACVKYKYSGYAANRCLKFPCMKCTDIVPHLTIYLYNNNFYCYLHKPMFSYELTQCKNELCYAYVVSYTSKMCSEHQNS